MWFIIIIINLSWRISVSETFAVQAFWVSPGLKNRARFLVQHCFHSGRKKKKKPREVPQTDGQSLRTWEKCTSKMTFGWGIDFHHFQSPSNGMKVKDFGFPTFQWLDYLKINHVAFFLNLWFTVFFFLFYVWCHLFLWNLVYAALLFSCLSLRLSTALNNFTFFFLTNQHIFI